MSRIIEIKTLDDAYQYLDLVRAKELPFADPKTDRQIAANSFIDAIVLVEVGISEKLTT
jgi:hypothetical protein